MYKKYLIPKGKHFCRLGFFERLGNILPKKFKNEFRIKVKFTESCIYEEPQVSKQINKLLGMSFGRVHKNSVRIGWRFDQGKLEFFGYVYDKGKRVISHLGWGLVGEEISFSILSVNNYWLFEMNSKKLGSYITSIDGKSKNFYWELFPYFGGKLVSPGNMEIYISDEGSM